MSELIRPEPNSGGYVVVARRYRPRVFSELVGQQPIAHALTNAIQTHRVGHAYLFTGARGVGKTSAARIFAKALNAPGGPQAEPDPESDVCRRIDSGEDVDVLEIDGASNRGIEEIRQLRSNVNVRPSRSRYKIYIIDEVHMLTQAAFNALLKTLEEPPEHVKFIFCTTDPDKIPITVLSRCQRFDFAPVATNEIVKRLAFIVETEGRQATPAALQLLARKAAGSMRDSQSLLEQVLSFCDGAVDVAQVHQMLGTAADERLFELLDCLIRHDAADALTQLDRAAREGVDLGQLAEQLLGCYRDVMTVAVDAPAELLQTVRWEDRARLDAPAATLGIEGVLAAIQVLDQTLVRLRQSTQSRTLVEMALVRVCRLDTLGDLSQLIAAIASGQQPPAANTARAAALPKKKLTNSCEPALEPPVEATPEAVDTVSAVQEDAEGIWQQTLDSLEDMAADVARFFDRVAISAPNRLVVSFLEGYTFQKESCERPDVRSRIETALNRVAGRRMQLDLEVVPGAATSQAAPAPHLSRRQRQLAYEKAPFVREAMQVFDAEVTRVEEPRKPR